MTYTSKDAYARIYDCILRNCDERLQALHKVDWRDDFFDGDIEDETLKETLNNTGAWFMAKHHYEYNSIEEMIFAMIKTMIIEFNIRDLADFDNNYYVGYTPTYGISYNSAKTEDGYLLPTIEIIVEASNFGRASNPASMEKDCLNALPETDRLYLAEVAKMPWEKQRDVLPSLSKYDIIVTINSNCEISYRRRYN